MSCNGFRTPLAFLHIPKTGGTTIHDLLCECFSPDRICSGVKCPENHRLDQLSADRLRDVDFFAGHFHRRSIESIGRHVNVVTVLREPKSRILSLYYFWKAHRPSYIRRKKMQHAHLAHRFSLIQFLRCPTPAITSSIQDVYLRLFAPPGALNPLSRHAMPKEAALDEAKDYLDSLFEIGVTEDLDSFVARLFRRLELPMPASVPQKNSHRDFRRARSMQCVEREEITDEIEGELERLTRLDQSLYHHACRRIRACAA